MKTMKTALALAFTALFAAPALAADDAAADMIQRNARQQERIEDGLRSGEINVREAAELERRAGRIEQYQARALRDGTLSGEETRRIDRMQDRFGREIYQQSHDAQRGNPDSRSAERMARDIDRSGDQQRRIAEGLRSGDLTYREAARLEQGQAQVSRRQAHAGADGYVGRREQQNLGNAQDRQGRNIWRQRHDDQQQLAQRDSGWGQRQYRDSGWNGSRYAQSEGQRGYYGGQREWGGRGRDGGQSFDRPRVERRQVAANTGSTARMRGTRDRMR